MALGERYDKIAEAFNSVRDDAKETVEQVEDGKISAWERSRMVRKSPAQRGRRGAKGPGDVVVMVRIQGAYPVASPAGPRRVRQGGGAGD